jgi:F0F1-type ATP synthase epsilon subunit
LAEMWHLQVRSPGQVLLDVPVVSLVRARLIDGPITLLRGHIALVGETAAGALQYRTVDGSEGEIGLQSGILRVDRERITVLTSGLAGPQSAAEEQQKGINGA